jgi:outer membrane protein OmpA-like peptidoglycan-associated protein/tetratricopeptide (TPR) repeat protein
VFKFAPVQKLTSYMRAVTLLFLLILSFSLFAEKYKDDFKDDFLLAESYIQEMEFTKAAEILKKLIAQNPDNANLQFKLGFCYLNSTLQKKEAITYLEKAVKNTSPDYDPEDINETSAPFETSYFLAQACYHNHHFERAKELYESFKNSLGNEVDPDIINEINRMIQINENAKQIVSNPLKIKVNALPEGINTPSIEYAPVISGDESTLIFTSNRIADGIASISDPDDIYIVSKEDNVWGTPKKLEEVCLPLNESTSSLSFDGNTLILYVNNDGDGNLFESERTGDSWSEPEEMPYPINGSDLETNGCYSPDKSAFYFTSNRPEGFGGLDIYVTRKMPNGVWSAAQNLGPNINTIYDEETPFIHPDNERLFFSSAGHNTMGGLDIFVSKIKNQSDWEKPENIGYPINSTNDDVGFTVSVDGRRGYYASYNDKSLGETDLFMIDMPDQVYTNLMVFSGYARDDDGNIIEGAEITAYDMETGEMFGVYAPNPRTGKFIIAARQGQKLELVFEAKGYESFTRHISVGTEEKNKTVPEVAMEDAKLNIRYNIPDFVLMPFDAYEIDMSAFYQLPEFLQAFTEVKIKLTGHTDAKGPVAYNKVLGRKRAQFVSNFLVHNGVKKERITLLSKGEEEPVAKNKINEKDSPEGRRFNRRVEIKLINAPQDKYTINKTPIPVNLIIN